jgi:hypothetical protein
MAWKRDTVGFAHIPVSRTAYHRAAMSIRYFSIVMAGVARAHGVSLLISCRYCVGRVASTPDDENKILQHFAAAGMVGPERSDKRLHGVACFKLPDIAHICSICRLRKPSLCTYARTTCRRVSVAIRVDAHVVFL